MVQIPQPSADVQGVRLGVDSKINKLSSYFIFVSPKFNAVILN